jgi:hypothetical protein
VKRWRACVILAIGLLGFGIYAYPGQMSFDSVWQLSEARAGVYTDWHPPAMAVLWHVLDHMLSGPFLMLVLQTVAFVAGCMMLLQRYLGRTLAAAGAIACLWFPPVAVTFAVVWKDCQMVGYLALGTAWILSERRGVRLGGLAMLTLASAMRHNAFTMTLPIIVMLWQWSPQPRVRRYAIAFAVWIAVTLVAMLANAALTDKKMHPWHGSLAMYDTIGTLRFSGETSDAVLRDELAGAPLDQSEDLAVRIREAYAPALGVFRIINDKLMHQPTTDAERDGMANAFRRVVLGHPGAYLWHRWRTFHQLLGLQPTLPNYVWIGVDETLPTATPASPNRIQDALQGGGLAIGQTWVMRPWIYALVLLVLVPLCIRARQRLPLVLVASALISELALFFLAPTPDFRYSLWLVPCVLMTVMMLVAQRVTKTPTA